MSLHNEFLSVSQDDVVCVSKEAVQDKNAVSLKLKSTSTCVSLQDKPFLLFMYPYVVCVTHNICVVRMERKETRMHLWH